MACRKSRASSSHCRCGSLICLGLCGLAVAACAKDKGPMQPISANIPPSVASPPQEAYAPIANSGRYSREMATSAPMDTIQGLQEELDPTDDQSIEEQHDFKPKTKRDDTAKLAPIPAGSTVIEEEEIVTIAGLSD